MQNEFEKQVQQKMDELRFAPTPPVWEKIEAQIRRKKERRRFLFWLPLLLLVAGSALWWLLSTPQHEGGKTTGRMEKAAQPLNTESPSSPVPQALTSSKNNTARVTQQTTSTNPSSTAIIDQSNLSHNTSNHTLATSLYHRTTTPVTLHKRAARINTGTNTAKTSTDHPTAAAETIAHSTAQSSKSHTPASSEIVAHANVPASNHPNITTVSTTNQKTISSNQQTLTASRETATGRPTIIALQPVNKILSSFNPSSLSSIHPKAFSLPLITIAHPASTYSRKFTLVASFSAGWSALAQSASAASANQDRTSAVGSTNALPRSPVVAELAPGPESGNNTFEVGLALEKRLSEHARISAGLGYSYFSTLLGLRQKGAASGITTTAFTGANFPGRTTPSYSNRYHFISLPVNVQLYTPGHGPLSFHAGLDLRYLVATNALRYNYGTQAYVKDQSSFHHAQLFSGIGLDYELKAKKSAWRVGPQFQYGLTPLYTNGPHAASYSLRLQYLLRH